MTVVTMLTFSALMYLMARQGAQYRSRQHTRVPRVEIDAHFADSQDSITVLVPSYREEPDLVRGTLISAALQEFPSLRVRLLIDDPPEPGTDLERELLNGASGVDYFYYGSPGADETNLGLNFGPYLDTSLRINGYEHAAQLKNCTITRVTEGAGTGVNAGKWRVEGFLP